MRGALPDSVRFNRLDGKRSRGGLEFVTAFRRRTRETVFACARIRSRADERQRRVAGAEVVDGEAHAELRPEARRARPRCRCMSTLSVISSSGRRRQPGAASAATCRRSSGWRSWRRREVDAHRERRRSACASPPLRGLAARARAPTADRHDQAGLLGERDELAGGDQPALGVRPSAPGPRSPTAPVGEVDDRLVVHAGARRVGAPQVASSCSRSSAPACMVGSKTCVRPRARALAGTSRCRRRAAAPRRLAGRPAEGDADAGARRHLGRRWRTDARARGDDALGDADASLRRARPRAGRRTRRRRGGRPCRRRGSGASARPRRPAARRRRRGRGCR